MFLKIPPHTDKKNKCVDVNQVSAATTFEDHRFIFTCWLSQQQKISSSDDLKNTKQTEFANPCQFKVECIPHDRTYKTICTSVPMLNSMHFPFSVQIFLRGQNKRKFFSGFGRQLYTGSTSN